MYEFLESYISCISVDVILLFSKDLPNESHDEICLWRFPDVFHPAMGAQFKTSKLKKFS